MNLAPIILFVYNRPEHTAKTLEALMANELSNQSELFIYCDGAKATASEETLLKIKETRTVIRKKEWCKKITIIESEVNKGLAQSIIDGVTEIVNKYGKIIVLEDDLVTAPTFLQFMNDALNVYESNADVACISGYIYPVKKKLPETFFIKGADCWGWATWQRAWNGFEPDGSKLLQQLENKKLTTAFDFENTYPYVQMLKDQINGKNNSWAIRWYASAFLENKYCLYPGISLVQNIGIDGSGTHSGTSDKWMVRLAKSKINVSKIEVKETLNNKQIIMEYFKSITNPNHSFFYKVFRKIKSIIK